MTTQNELDEQPTVDTRPILIVGAGPTGLTAAMELTRFGIPIRIVDRLLSPATTTRAHSVQTRTLELFGQRGLSQAMLPLGNPATAATIHGRGKLLGKINLEEIKSRYNYTFLLAQVEIERLLREHLAERGIHVEQGTELIAFAQQPSATQSGQSDGIKGMLRHRNGTLEELDAAYLICAEGAHSTIRPTSGLEFEGKSLEQSYVLADLSLDGNLPDNELAIFAAEQGFLAVFPLGNHTFRLVATDPERHAKTDSPPTVDELQRVYDRNAHIPVRLRDITWSSRYVINSRMIPLLRVGHIFFGGDAAHIHSPVGGQGMNTGIQDMIDLSWKLAMVVKGQAVPELLNTFEEERLPIIRNVVTKTEAATEALNSDSTLVHQLITYLAPVLLSTQFVQQLATGLLSEVALHYRDSSFSQTHQTRGTLRAGDRMPDLDVLVCNNDAPNAGQPPKVSLYDLLDPSCFTFLMATDGETATLLTPARVEQLRRWQGILKILPIASVRSQPVAKARFNAAFGSRRSLVLVRPDSYIGFIGTPDGWSELIAWLTRWFPPVAP